MCQINQILSPKLSNKATERHQYESNFGVKTMLENQQFGRNTSNKNHCAPVQLMK